MKRIGQIVGAALGTPIRFQLILLIIFVYTIYAVVKSILVAIMAAIKAKPDPLSQRMRLLK